MLLSQVLSVGTGLIETGTMLNNRYLLPAKAAYRVHLNIGCCLRHYNSGVNAFNVGAISQPLRMISRRGCNDPGLLLRFSQRAYSVISSAQLEGFNRLLIFAF